MIYQQVNKRAEILQLATKTIFFIFCFKNIFFFQIKVFFPQKKAFFKQKSFTSIKMLIFSKLFI